MTFSLRLSDRLALMTCVEATFQKVEQAVRMLRGDTRRYQGYFCFYTEHWDVGAPDSFTRHLQLAMPVGVVNDFDRAKQVETNAFEKAHRLGLPMNRNHVSSWTTRNFDAGRYGGAIRVIVPHELPTVGIFSFSGLPEHGDETLDLSVAEHLGYDTWVERILSTSGNEIAPKLITMRRNSPPPLELFAR